MGSQNKHDGKHWFVLHFIRPTITARPQTYIDTFNRDTARVELFAPTIKPAQIVDGQVVFKERLLTYHYVFVKAHSRMSKNSAPRKATDSVFWLTADQKNATA